MKLKLHKKFNVKKFNPLKDYVFDTLMLEEILKKTTSYPYISQLYPEDVEALILALIESGYMDADKEIIEAIIKTKKVMCRLE